MQLLTPAYMSEESSGEDDKGPVIIKHTPTWRSAGTKPQIAMAKFNCYCFITCFHRFESTDTQG